MSMTSSTLVLICTKSFQILTSSIQFVNITSIKDDDDSVIRLGSVISCCSPYISEISQSKSVLESKWVKAILQFKSPIRSYSTSRESNFPIRV